ncbi:pyruvate kinase [Fragilariopsis cylindrus CCMP1102]|uniref:Pyruvate kinase n=1 Tax=Fragilariopsis cylindrus CCMP1102 TaxID=635003 RepID=A0A1E7FM47_9STRA|nr:pyruvate kinase [Fragilariopsis cylindrus CCMP1102]|eukprot:OEU19216.1 pyruvate kinase [Fragilariopsis cylindrus CCMP1102]
MFSQVIARQCCRQVTKQGVVVPAMSGLISSSSSSMMINSRRSFSDTNKIGSSEHSRLPLTKIVATIGPTSEQAEPLKKVVEAGMKIMRLNFSHATTEEVELRLTNLALCQVQDVRATLLDTRGPEIRSGKLAHDDSGHETIQLQKNDTITLQTSEEYAEASTDKDLFINYSKLHLCMKPGMKVLLDDGAAILTVVSINESDGTVVCSVDNSAELRSRAGVNIPNAETDLPAMSEKDKTDIKYGLEIDVDYVAASFIQTADGVREIRNYMIECAKELGVADRPLPLIISKIESASALKHFDEILQESDGIMVARGDLGVEIPIMQVTNAQKEMVAACNSVGKPVIVATQMLESMAKNPRPTRAEVSDVTNAVYDGADAVMTSGETAKGKYPNETIKMMTDIILSAEHYYASGSLDSLYAPRSSLFTGDSSDPMTAVAKGAVAASLTNDCKAILVFTETGKLPCLVAAFRPNCPIVTFCPTSKVARQLILTRGVYPIVGLQDTTDDEEMIEIAMKEAERMGFVSKGDSIAAIYADPKSTTFKLAQV